MGESELFFEGRALPAAAVAEDLSIARVRGGRSWSTKKPLAIWRTFSELDLGSKADILGWLRRYGDPQGGAPSDTSHIPAWKTLQVQLHNAAQGWEDVDGNGVSHITLDPSRLMRARFFAAEGERVSPTGNVRIYDVINQQDRETGYMVRRAVTLSAFMLASASLMLEAGTPMRRCAECGHWADASHGLTRYCSNACRLRVLRRNKENEQSRAAGTDG